MPIFFNLQSFINVIKSVMTNDLLPDLCYVASNFPEKKPCQCSGKKWVPGMTRISLKSHWYLLVMKDLEERLIWLGEGLVNEGEIKMLT